jgi:peptidoglycan hydrolase-like protein with peptidoglycan-binding domain
MSTESSGREIRLHADTLEYTRDGLRTREPLSLFLEPSNRIVIERPAVIPAVAASHGGFADKQSFPLPAFLSLFVFPHSGNLEGLFEGKRPRSGVYQVFAHTRSTGNEQADKDLTDRRARVTTAFLTGDVDTVIEIAREEAWELDRQQVMLRALRCDPGPIDGQLGPLTRHAIEVFQRDYVKGLFHTEFDREPRHPTLAPSGELDDDTILALIEAYTVAHSPLLDRDQLHPTHPEAGCAAFNPLADGSHGRADNRVSLVVHDALPPHHDAAPCRTGDPAACPAVDSAPHRCAWHRAHVRDALAAEVEHHHFRLAWLPLPKGKILLSALTTVPDADEVEFEVFAAREPVDGEILSDPTILIEPLGEILTTKPVLGVAFVIWDPPAEFAPASDGNLHPPDGPPSTPVFRVMHPKTETEAYDTWPADEIAVLFDRNVIDDRFTAHAATIIELVCEEQGLRLSRPSGEATPYGDEHYILRFEGVEPHGTFSLFVTYADGDRRPLFEGVPYDQLGDHGPPADPLPSQDGSEGTEPSSPAESAEASAATDDEALPVIDFDLLEDDRPFF